MMTFRIGALCDSVAATVDKAKAIRGNAEPSWPAGAAPGKALAGSIFKLADGEWAAAAVSRQPASGDKVRLVGGGKDGLQLRGVLDVGASRAVKYSLGALGVGETKRFYHDNQTSADAYMALPAEFAGSVVVRVPALDDSVDGTLVPLGEAVERLGVTMAPWVPQVAMPPDLEAGFIDSLAEEVGIEGWSAFVTADALLPWVPSLCSLWRACAVLDIQLNTFVQPFSSFDSDFPSLDVVGGRSTLPRGQGGSAASFHKPATATAQRTCRARPDIAPFVSF